MLLVRRFAVALMIALAAIAPLGVMPARATINSSVNKTIVLGNGSQTQFTFSFVGVAAAYIGVIYTDAGGNQTVLTQGAGATQYQIALNAPLQGAIWGIGGTITYNPSGTPIAGGTTLTIFRTLPLTQAIVLQNQSSIATLGKGSEAGLDTGVMQAQQISENISRAIAAPISDPTPPAPLPPIAQRANQGAAFDSAGNLVAGATPASGVISSAMQPVVNAASLALGRTALGLKAMAQEGIGSGLQDDGSGNARFNSTLVSVSTNQSVDATFALKTYIATGPINFNLARANTLWNGFSIKLFVLAAPVTLIPDANDSIQGRASGSNVAIPANSVATIATDGAASGNWRVDWTPVSSVTAAASLAPGPGVGATLQASPANPTGTTSGTAVMMGLGSTCKVTPVYATRVVLHIQGYMSNSTVNAQVFNTARYGTGSAPANAAAVAGTTIGSTVQSFTGPANYQTPFNVGGIITGLTAGVQVWFDLDLRQAVGGTATVANISCSALEF